MNILIRPSQLTDSEFITNLSDQLGYKTANDKILKRLVELSQNADNRVFVASYNNSIVGWIHACYCLRVESDAFVEIGGLVVEKDHRKKGIAKMLIDEVISWAKSKEINKLRVRSNTIRKETHAYYLNLGFKEIKEQKIFDLEV